MSKNKKTILVISRNSKHKGGVVGFINSIVKFTSSENYHQERFIVGQRIGYQSKIFYFIFFAYDVGRFIKKLFNSNIKLVHLNPSLGYVPIIRDGFFLIISKFMSKKTIIFWHGWSLQTQEKIDKHPLLKYFFFIIYSKADAFIVLSAGFKEKLITWGFPQNIYVENTSVDDDLTCGFDFDVKRKKIYKCETFNILFFSRLEISKGILEIIDAFVSLDDPKRILRLIIAGDGNGANIVKNKLDSLSDSRIQYLGYVQGDLKKKILAEAHLMCLPSRSEGMPVAILEAMAFGVPIIATPVGGIPSIVIEGENGFYVKSPDLLELTRLFSILIEDLDLVVRIGAHNYETIKKNYVSSVVGGRICEIYGRVLGHENFA